MKKTWKLSTLLDLCLILGLMLLLYQIISVVLPEDSLIPYVAASLLSLLAYVIRRRF